MNRYSGRITATVFAESEEQAQAVFDAAFPYTHDQGGCVDLVECDIVLEEENTVGGWE